MTTISFALSPTFNGTALNVYAYAFANGTPVASANVVLNGGPQATSSINLGTISSGNIVVVTQDQVAGVAAIPASVFNSLNSLANVTNAQTYNYRYDTIELTLGNQGSDVADITNIVQFGQPMSLSVTYSDGSTQTRGYAVPGSTIVTALQALTPASAQANVFQPWATGSPLTAPRETMSLANNLVPNPLNIATDWDAYISGFSTVASSVRLASVFSGVANTANTAYTVSPSLSYYTTSVSGTNIVLTPQSLGNLQGWVGPTSSAQGYWTAVPTTPGVIKIPINAAAVGNLNPYLTAGGAQTLSGSSGLDQNIYSQPGGLAVFDPTSGNPYPNTTASPNAATTFTPNNAYGDITKMLAAGFDAGYWGAKAETVYSANMGQPGFYVDLNKSWNWLGAYAYGAVMPNSVGNYGYSNTIGMGTGTVGDPNRKMFYDPFAAEFFKTANAYGYSYTDLLSRSGGGANPTISMYDTGTSKNVANMNVTLFDLNATPTGYSAPPALFQMPSAASVSQSYTNPQGHILNVNAAIGVNVAWNTTALVGPGPNTPISFRFYAPNDTSAQKGADGFVTLALPTGAGSGTGWTAGMPAYAAYYTVTNTANSWSLVQGNPTNTPGNFIFYDVPMTNDNSTMLYQIVIGSGSKAKTYNLYANGSGGVGSTGTFAPGAIMDGGANAPLLGKSSIANDELVLSLSATGVTWDLDYLDLTQSPAPTPQKVLASPLVGSNSGGTFTPISTATPITQGDMAFSYTGGNAVTGGNVAKLILADTVHNSWIMTPMSSQSGMNGDWLTSMSAQFGDGTYSAFMQQYKSTDWALNTPVGLATTPVAFTVALDKLTLSATADLHGLQVSSTASTKGNWIDLSAVSSTVTNGTLVAFATDAAGNMLTRDTNVITTSLDAAALGRIGVVASDDHSMVFFSGKQQVYLTNGERLEFAMVSGDGTVDLNPTINVSGAGAGKFNVQVADGAGTFNIAAEINNSLDSSAMLASSQRVNDNSWLYLKQGTQVRVDLAWSGDYVNTLHFVRMDVNPANPQQLRVAGVDYGNTDAFRTAVATNWEFTSTQGHSTGSTSATWTVAGADGFYAPVLVSGRGDIWMINQSPTSTANADGHQHIRNFGANTFGFEDMNAAAGADFDFNDMVMKTWLV